MELEQLLTTKLYIPQTRPELVSRPSLLERLNGVLQRKLTLISAPAGFGKTTLVVEWLQLLAKGLTNPEIAARLYLSQQTVKVHARNIYAKISVNYRTQAVTKGRSLGLMAQE